jgi:hypothetical protein
VLVQRAEQRAGGAQLAQAAQRGREAQQRRRWG